MRGLGSVLAVGWGARVVVELVNDARNFICVVTGRKGSGKSRVLGSYARRFPRRVILDFTGEHEREPGARVGYTLRQCAVALAAARASGQRWTVVCALDPRDVPALLAALMPLGMHGGESFARAVGGLVVECGEINEIAVNHAGIAREVSAMFTRGRHHWLSVLAAARTSTEMHKIVTSQADVVCAFRQHQARDVARIGELMGERAIPALRDLAPYEYLRYFVDAGRLEHVRADGRATTLADD